MQLTDPKKRILSVSSIIKSMEEKVNKLETEQNPDEAAKLKKDIIFLNSQMSKIIKKVRGYYRYY